MRVPWSVIKSSADTNSLNIQYVDISGAYWIKLFNGPFELECIINQDDVADTDLIDFEANYKAASNGKLSISTTPDANDISAEFQSIKVAHYKPEDSSTIKVSHDWTDKTTWYTRSVSVMGETRTDEGSKVYGSSQAYWIDACHGKIYMEDIMHNMYKVKVFDDGVQITEDSDFAINYVTGKVTLDAGYTAIGVITANFHYATTSEWVLKPDAGKKLILEHSEIQFTDDIDMSNPMRFEIWVFNPYFNSESPTVDWFEGATFGVDNFLKFPYKVIQYKNLKDIINSCNLGQGAIPALTGIGRPIVVFPFEYLSVQTLKDVDGAELRLILEGDVPMGGTWGTITLYVFSINQ